MDDELHEGRVDDVSHAGTWSEQVAHGEQRPKHSNTQHRQQLQSRVLTPVTRHLAKPHRVQELLTVRLCHELNRKIKIKKKTHTLLKSVLKVYLDI